MTLRVPNWSVREGKMLKYIIAAIATSCMTFVAVGQPLSENEIRAVNELSGELLECSVYFTIGVQCMRGHPDPSIPRLIKTYEEMSTTAGVKSMQVGKVVGVTDAAVGSRMKLITNEMTKSMNNNCVNISVLLERYANFCQQLLQDMDPRLIELKQDKKCTGSYKCIVQ
jgi:hypothetical protein